MSKKIISLIIVVVIIGVIYGISINNSSQVNEGAIKIGFITPLTGPFPDWGESIQNGVILAVEDTKNNIVVDYQDDGCQAKLAVGIAKKFFSIDDIHVIIGPGCDDSLKAIAPLTKENNVLLLSTGLLGDDVFLDNPTNVINLATQISTEAKYMASYLNSQGIEKLSIVYGNNSFGQELSKTLTESLASYDIEVVSNEKTSLELTDFRTVIAKGLQKKADAFYIHHSLKSVGIFAKQLREVKEDAVIYSLYSAESPSTLEWGGVATNGIQYTYPVNSSEGSTDKKRFEERYLDRFGTNPTPNSYFAYDGVILIDEALSVCSYTDGDCVEQFLKNYGEYTGLSGDMRIENDGKNIRPFGIKEIRDGGYVWVTKELEI